MNKYISFEYLTQNNPAPYGVQYKGLFGNRSIGKTHGVLKYVYNQIKESEEETAFLILRRNKLELNMQPFITKYSTAFNTTWEIEKGNIIKEDDKIIAYYNALSLAERAKNNNYDAPFITHIIVDEVYAEKPNKNEFQQLQTWITTVSRRTGHPFHPITVWLLGNNEYGYSPIMNELQVFPEMGLKQKKSDGVFLFSKMKSPSGAINVESPLVKKMDIKEKNNPIYTWNYNGIGYEIYDFNIFLYIKRANKKVRNVWDTKTREVIFNQAYRKSNIPAVYVETYDCLKFLENFPKNILYI